MGETRVIRDEALQFCVGNGVDLGCSDEKICESAIGIDHAQNPCVNYLGDARTLPFKDTTLDYVYSSHLLEDFENTAEILSEWCRVLKVGGHLILYLPIQKVYAANSPDGIGNPSHRVDMSMEYLIKHTSELPLRLIKSIPLHCIYSFFAVFIKE